MRDVVDICRKRSKIFSSFNPIKLKDLNSRKKINMYLGVDLNKYYTIIIYISKKSRILKKEAMEFLELHKRLEEYKGTKIVKKCIIIQAPICSKAKAMLVENGWDVIVL